MVHAQFEPCLSTFKQQMRDKTCSAGTNNPQKVA